MVSFHYLIFSLGYSVLTLWEVFCNVDFSSLTQSPSSHVPPLWENMVVSGVLCFRDQCREKLLYLCFAVSLSPLAGFHRGGICLEGHRFVCSQGNGNLPFSAIDKVGIRWSCRGELWERGEAARLSVYNFCLGMGVVQVVAALCLRFAPLGACLAVTPACCSAVEHRARLGMHIPRNKSFVPSLIQHLAGSDVSTQLAETFSFLLSPYFTQDHALFCSAFPQQPV